MREVLARLNRVYAKDEQEWQLLLEGLGTPNQFPQSALLGHARVWESCTPYLHPWFRKKHFGVSQQVERECHLRGLPALESIDVLPDLRSPRVLDFRRFRSKAGLTQPDRHGCRLRLTFSEPLSGPLALGFACHFGLGLFSPVERA